MSDVLKISDVARIVDCEHKTAPVVALDEAYGFAIGTPALRSDRINFSEAKPVSRETFNEWSQRTELRVSDVIMAREAPAGGLGWVDGKHNVCLGQRTVCIRADAKKIDPKFLYYKLHDPAIQQQIEKMSAGSTVHHINVADIKKLPLRNLPSLKEQQRAVEILNEIDSCIDLNLGIISQLEEMSRKLYDYWFMQFEFPNEDGDPFKSSGGKMEWSDELQKDIPQGWQVLTLSKLLIENSIAYAQPKVPAGIKVIDLSVMPSGTFVLDISNTSDNFSTNLFELKKYDLLFGGIRPYLRKAGFSPIDGLVTGTVHSFRPIDHSDFNFVLLTFVHESVFNFAIAHSKGTKMPVVASKDLLSYKVAYKKEVSQNFQNVLNLHETVATKVRQNSELRRLRDHLIPLVVNGIVDLSSK
jgi:type I restriction enzyme S subunit